MSTPEFDLFYGPGTCNGVNKPYVTEKSVKVYIVYLSGRTICAAAGTAELRGFESNNISGSIQYGNYGHARLLPGTAEVSSAKGGNLLCSF